MLCQDKICLLWACQCIALTKSEANIWNHVVCEYARLGYYSYNYWQNMNQTWLLWSHSSAFCQYISEVVFAIISFEKHGSITLNRKLHAFLGKEKDCTETPRVWGGFFSPPLRGLCGQQLPVKYLLLGNLQRAERGSCNSLLMMYSVVASASNMHLLQNLHF